MGYLVLIFVIVSFVAIVARLLTHKPTDKSAGHSAGGGKNDHVPTDQP